jgi:hypothetical protein
VVKSDGITYDKSWLSVLSHVSPITGKIYTSQEFMENVILKKIIELIFKEVRKGYVNKKEVICDKTKNPTSVTISVIPTSSSDNLNQDSTNYYTYNTSIYNSSTYPPYKKLVNDSKITRSRCCCIIL